MEDFVHTTFGSRIHADPGHMPAHFSAWDSRGGLGRKRMMRSGRGVGDRSSGPGSEGSGSGYSLRKV